MSIDNAGLIIEALVEEIHLAERWTTIEKAWRAILTVRRMSREMEKEREHLARGANNGTGTGSMIAGGTISLS